MSSKAHEQLKKLVFSRQGGYTKDFRYWTEYDPNDDISIGYYRDSPVITIYWKKDLVVLSDCGWRTQTTRRLLNTLLPSYLKLQGGEWVLQSTRYLYPQGTFAWTGSQTLSLSEHYKTHVTPWATMKFELGKVTIKPTESFIVVTVIGVQDGFKVSKATAILKESRSMYSQSFRWGMTPVSGLYEKKKDAVNAALIYAAQHKLPYIEKLKARYISYEFNPYV